VNVCVAVGVDVGVSDAGGACVNVGSGVSICPDGWKGVGVGDEFGSCVIKINVGKTGAVGVGEAQDARRVKSKKQYMIRDTYRKKCFGEAVWR
jgi:hypothetical protein